MARTKATEPTPVIGNPAADLPSLSNDDLQARRERLTDRITGLESQHVELARDMGQADDDWRAGLAAGDDVHLISERQRHLKAEMQENERAADQISAWIAEIDTERARRVPHQQLDEDLVAYRADVDAFADEVAALEGEHQRLIDAFAADVAELHAKLWGMQDRHAQLSATGHQLRVRSTALERDEHVPAPATWETALSARYQSTHYWRSWIATIAPARRNRAGEVVTEFGSAAGRVAHDRATGR